MFKISRDLKGPQPVIILFIFAFGLDLTKKIILAKNQYQDQERNNSPKYMSHLCIVCKAAL